MAKASASKKKQTAGPERADAQASAAQIAEIDRQIAALIQQRAEVLKAAASPTAASTCAAGFDDLALAKIVEETAGPLPKTTMRAVFRELHERLPGLGAAVADRTAGADLQL